jgi:hypothetical protein
MPRQPNNLPAKLIKMDNENRALAEGDQKTAAREPTSGPSSSQPLPAALSPSTETRSVGMDTAKSK